MKKHFVLILFTLSIAVIKSKANEVNVLIVNKSDYSIYGNSSEIKNGSFLVNDHGTVSPAEVKKGGTAAFSTGQALAFCGTDGFVTYKAIANGQEYFFTVQFDVPYIGNNEFHYSANAPFNMKHIVGGPGSNVTITFELTGGPTAITPPAPPVILKTTGSVWKAGSINWNSNIVGLPEGNITDAFDFEVIAPSKFFPNYPVNNNPSFTSGEISPTSGRFSDYKPLPNINVQVVQNTEISTNEKFSKRIYAISLKYTIANLPNNIPLEIRVTPKFSFWAIGNGTPLKPSVNELVKWTVFLEKTKSQQGSDNFKVNGAWVDAQGNVKGQQNENNTLAGQFLNKQEIILKNDFVIYGDEIYKVPGIERKRVQLNENKINAPIKTSPNVKLKMLNQ